MEVPRYSAELERK